MDNQVLRLLMQRFDTLEDQNKRMINLFIEHDKEDRKMAKLVERHNTYFGIMGLGLTPVIGWIAYKLGFSK